jgi:hypothetical protein
MISARVLLEQKIKVIREILRVAIAGSAGV